MKILAMILIMTRLSCANKEIVINFILPNNSFSGVFEIRIDNQKGKSLTSVNDSEYSNYNIKIPKNRIVILKDLTLFEGLHYIMQLVVIHQTLEESLYGISMATKQIFNYVIR